MVDRSCCAAFDSVSSGDTVAVRNFAAATAEVSEPCFGDVGVSNFCVASSFAILT